MNKPLAGALAVSLLLFFGSKAQARVQPELVLDKATIVVSPDEPSYVQYAAKDLSSYLGSITGIPAVLADSDEAADRSRASLLIAVGAKALSGIGIDVAAEDDLKPQGFEIRTIERNGKQILLVAGPDPHGTNMGVATLIANIRANQGSASIDSPLNIKSNPSFLIRGIHLNGWPLAYPYAFRSWKESDWKRFIDIAWSERANLIYLWPFMEILPVPLSSEDEAYLQEVRRIVDYAHNERGMEVWIMQSANRIGTSDCGVRDPRFRPYWVNGCQKDMNPADPQQFQKIMHSFEALYKVVDNADAFCMIDSDPGGWPQSPLSYQVKIFNGARKLLDRYSQQGAKTKLVDWMHVGWGRHKLFTATDSVVGAYDWTDKNPDESDVEFMGRTIENFKANLPEPWELIAGQPPYLSIVQKEQVLSKTVYLPYGAIESEPAFPSTNIGQDSVRRVFDKAAQYPGLRGVMGNNQLMLLQFPRTFYFFSTAWDLRYESEDEKTVMRELASQLYPDHTELIADAFLALRDDDLEQLVSTLGNLKQFIDSGKPGRIGSIGRFLFPDALVVARILEAQLQIRVARQKFILSLRGRPTVAECRQLLENYFDALLAWNKETGWDKMIAITVWPNPIYEDGKDMQQAVYRLKQILAAGGAYANYAKVNSFFSGITAELVPKYGEDSVMIGCIEPMKLAVLQSQ